MRSRRVAMPAVAVIFAVGTLGVAEATPRGWVEVDPGRLASIRVGEAKEGGGPVINKCCRKGERNNCPYLCTTNPNCPKGYVDNGTCAAATCADVDDPVSKCSTPARAVTAAFTGCEYTGAVGRCNTEPGDYCLSAPKAVNLAYTACNPSEAVCAAGQPANACP